MIVFANDKAIGRLVAPRVDVSGRQQQQGSSRGVEDGGSSSRDSLLELVTLTYDYWQPVAEKKQLSERQICIPVSQAFKSSVYRLQILGTNQGSRFALPFSYTFSGSDTAASLSQHQQRVEYAKAQHSRFSELQEGQRAGGHPFYWSQQQYTVECGEPDTMHSHSCTQLHRCA